MGEKKGKLITKSMILYELRNVTGNPFVHIFGVGMPVLMSILITHMVTMEMTPLWQRRFPPVFFWA